MKNIFVLIAACFFSLSMAAEVVVNYTPDESIFPNPERGFTDQIDGILKDSKPSLLKSNEDYFTAEGDRETQRLVMLMYYLKEYRTKNLSQAVLDGFDADMQILRKYGFKCVLRFGYNSSSKDDASLEQTQAHIEQLKPLLAKNADVIYVLEAGFVGQWGEWYYSKNHGNETQQLTANRRAILESLIDACPADRHLLVRYPLIKTQYLGDEKTLTAETAHDGSARAKIGHHNDAFLNDWGNDGTYGRDGEGEDDDPVLRNYIAQETKYVPNGGESNVEDNAWAKKVYKDAEKEMEAYHWSFCGAEYAEQITGLWRANGIFDTLNKRMGYRFQMTKTIWPEQVEKGTAMPLQMTLKNVGCAPLYNERKAYLILKSDKNTYSLPLPTDPRTWYPELASITINGTIDIPSSVAEGTYRLYLHLPDACASIANDARYAIRFANTNMWDKETGWNDLNATIQVVSTTQAIDNQAIPTQPTKIIRDGHVLIQKDGNQYTILGNPIR